MILFNVDSKSTADSKINKEAIKDVFMKVFNDYLGYCGSIPFFAEFERKLEEQGQYEAFQKKFEEKEGISWKEGREDYYFVQEAIVGTIVDLGIIDAEPSDSNGGFGDGLWWEGMDCCHLTAGY